jgi:hypothetical protein
MSSTPGIFPISSMRTPVLSSIGRNTHNPIGIKWRDLGEGISELIRNTDAEGKTFERSAEPSTRAGGHRWPVLQRSRSGLSARPGDDSSAAAAPFTHVMLAARDDLDESMEKPH